MAAQSAGISESRLLKLQKWQQKLVDEELLPNTHVIIWRNGKYCYDESTGARDLKGTPIGKDTIFRYYSMSKPIVSVALMLLYEEGRFLLTDPAYMYLGKAWKKQNMRVYKAGDFDKGYTTTPCTKNITIKNLLTHTSGLSYGFDVKGIVNKVDRLYYKEGVITPERGSRETSVASFVDRLAKAPLLFQPGSAYMYGFNVEVIGRLIEVLSGTTLDKFLQERIFAPLGMNDTGFWVPEDKADRFCSLWMPKGAQTSMAAGPTADAERQGLQNIEHETDGGCLEGGVYNSKFRPNRFLGGGGGLVGTAADYARFCEMLMLGGRCPGGERILSNKTLEWMTTNHLEKDGRLCNMIELSLPGYSETTSTDGVGFGLGFEVCTSAASTRQINSDGSFRWGGAASTTFFCDPAEDMFVVMMTALRYRNDFVLPLTQLLRQVAYACIDDTEPRERRMRVDRARSRL